MSNASVFTDTVRTDQPVLTPDPKGSLSIPISFFSNVRDNGARGFLADINHEMPWRDVCAILAELADTPYDHKADAPLFSPTVYSGTRREQNATTSALVVIDADGGFDFDAAVRFLTEHKIEAIVHTTASNTDGNRFHILVPLLKPVDPETHKAVVKAVCAFLKPGWKPDTSKNNCYSLFYAPASYSAANNEFVHIEGAVFPADAWLQLADQALSDGVQTAPTVRATETTWTSSFDCPYVDQECVQEYVGLTDDFYNGLFSFMCRVSLSALRRGVELVPAQIADLARDVERLSGRTHKSWDVETRDLDGEAENALAFARREIAQAPTPTGSRIERCGTMAGFMDWMMSDDTALLHPVATLAQDKPVDPIVEWNAGLDDRYIEPRQWLLGNVFCRRYVSTVVADGGTGKTALRIAQAIALATGKPITGEHVFRRCRVLYVSLEDDQDEMRRRIKACCQHHQISRGELRDHLFVAALANGPELATMTKGSGV